MSIQVTNLSLIRNHRQLLNDINFAAECGEMIAIVGENGSGKSTLLNCLSGLHETHNNVSINDLPIECYSLPDLSKVRAVLPQDNHLTFPFTVKEVVRLGLSLLSVELVAQESIIDQCLSLVDASQYKDRTYNNLSGGEKQRVHLARVLAQISDRGVSSASVSLEKNRKRYLFLDEPTSALDLKHQYQTLKMLNALRQENIGVFIIVHDLNLASFYCDKILVLKQGQMLACDTPEIIMQNNLIKEAFDVDVFIEQHPTRDKPYMINYMD